MSNRDNHTTIRVRNEVAKKLRAMQDGTDLTLSDIISNCIAHVEGAVIDDTENLYREQVAFDLQYYDADSSKVIQVSFRDCQKSQVHDVFNANTDITAKEYSNETAEVIFKDEDSCILRLTQKTVDESSERIFQNILHVALF